MTSNFQQDIKQKQEAFNTAIQAYHKFEYYGYVYKAVSLFNVSAQILLFLTLFTFQIAVYWYLLLFIIAYYLTDFINGLVHLYMDNNDDYETLFGPFIASFHLHHKTPKYRDNTLFMIYFNESGPKFWLVPYLTSVIVLSYLGANEILLTLLIYVGILSSVAEVSHYLCHNSKAAWVIHLQNLGVLLSKSHHNHHHKDDNKNYAFLNGMSDPLINYIAKKYYAGYVHGTDLHFEAYNGVDTKNRS